MIDWLAAALIISAGIWVWIWAVVCFILVLAFSENEKNFWAFVTVTAFVALMQYSGHIEIFNNPLAWVGWGVVYFVAGGVWSFVKWQFFLNEKAEAFGEAKLKWLRKYNRSGDRLPEEELDVDIKTKIPPNLISTFNKFLSDEYYHYRFNPRGDYGDNTLDGVIPSAKDNKEKLVTWILWWPTSFVWTMLNDPLVKFANWMYSKFQSLYTKMAKRSFAKFDI